jgi:dipeptidyl aminopeptidase/acylaminoacyl peptidase
VEKIVLDDFLKINAISSLAWAPEGDRAAFLVHRANEEKNGYDSNLWLYEAGDGSLRQLTWAGDVKSFVWDGPDAITFPALRDAADKAIRDKGEDHTAFYTLSLDGGCALRSFSVPLNATVIGKLDRHVYVLQARADLEKNRRLQNLTGAARDQELAAIQEEKSRFVIFDEYPFWFNGMGITNKTRLGLWLYNSANGTLTQITAPLMDVEGVQVCSRDGKVVYHGHEFDTVRDFRTGIWVYDYATGKTTKVVEQGIYRVRQVSWMNGKAIFAGTDMADYNYSQTPALWAADPETGAVERICPESLSIGNPVGTDARYGSGTVFKADGNRLYLISGIDDASRLIAIEPDGTVTSLVEKAGMVDNFDVRDGEILFVAMHDMALEELYRLEKPGSWKQLSSFNGEFCRTHSIVHPEELRFTDPDGFEIHGFVLRPVGFDPAKKYPGILAIHGGPRLSYGAVYYHDMQYWANHGYFVFLANPRGSDSRGDEFAFIRGKYGTVEYQNLMEFTDHVLEAYPQIDPARLGVAGGSYGGFMTNWIIGHTHRFAAAASQRSISNFVSMEGTSDCGRTFLDGHIGALTSQNMLKVWAQSPLSAAHNCTTPTLFIHSEEDYRCWKVEGLQMFNAIREKGVDARFCLFKGENHDLSRSGKPKNRRKRLLEITNWLDKYLKP